MNKTGVRTTVGEPSLDILFNTKRQGYGVRVNATGVTATNSDGKKIIYAGQALGAAADPRAEALRQTPLSLAWSETITGTVYGVTQHDIVFDDATDIANANLLFEATIDSAKMIAAAKPIPAAIIAALQTNGVRVTYVNGAPQPTDTTIEP